MTDKGRIKDLERRVNQLEDILERLGVSGDSHLTCYTGVDRYGNSCRTDLSGYIHSYCKFGKSEESNNGNSNQD